MNLADEVAQHLLRDLEVADHPVLERTDRADGTGGLAEHVTCYQTNRLAVVQDNVGPFAHRHHGRFVEDDPFVPDANQRRTGTEIDTHVHTEDAED